MDKIFAEWLTTFESAPGVTRDLKDITEEVTGEVRDFWPSEEVVLSVVRGCFERGAVGEAEGVLGGLMSMAMRGREEFVFFLFLVI